MYILKRMDKKTGKAVTVETNNSMMKLQSVAAMKNMMQSKYAYFVVEKK